MVWQRGTVGRVKHRAVIIRVMQTHKYHMHIGPVPVNRSIIIVTKEFRAHSSADPWGTNRWQE